MDTKQRTPLFSRRDLMRILLPLALQGILSVAIGMVDSMMVSNKGEAAFAGVSLIGSLDTVLITLFGALTSGGSVVLAQAMGRGDQKHACESAKQLVYAAASFAALISASVLLLRGPLLRLLFGEVEESVMHNALSYFSIVALSFPLLAIENSIAAARVSRQSSTPHAVGSAAAANAAPMPASRRTVASVAAQGKRNMASSIRFTGVSASHAGAPPMAA